VDCYAQNVDGVYLAYSPLPQPNLSQVPTFTLGLFDVLKMYWYLPPFSLRYLAITTLMYETSQGNQVFAEVGNPINVQDMATLCGKESVDLMWGSSLRILVSANQHRVEEILQTESEEGLCTLILPIPGEPLTSLEKPSYCTSSSFNVSTFVLLVRLALPSVNESEWVPYVSDSNNVAKFVLERTSARGENECQVRQPFPYPTYYPLVGVSDEVQMKKVRIQFYDLVNSVKRILFDAYPTIDRSTFHISSTSPYLNDIGYPQQGGFACINTSTNCQGATRDSTYLRSRIFPVTNATFFLVVGCIHHDFILTSFYSSLSMYQFANDQDSASSTGILSVIDQDQRSSALSYKKNADHFYVAQFGYQSMTQLPPGTLFRTYSLEQVPLNTNVFFLTRTYAHQGVNPDDLLMEVILSFDLNLSE
jgi:hypothetical protein